jgi:hypothetical protein
MKKKYLNYKPLFKILLKNNYYEYIFFNYNYSIIDNLKLISLFLINT